MEFYAMMVKYIMKKLHPKGNKSFKILENSLIEKKKFPDTQLVPMTLEGCVVPTGVFRGCGPDSQLPRVYSLY